MVISSVAPTVEAAAATDSCTKLPAVAVMVLLVTLANVGSAIALPPERMRSPRELAFERSLGTTMRRSAGDGRYELTFVRADEGASTAAMSSIVVAPEAGAGQRRRCEVYRKLIMAGVWKHRSKGLRPKMDQSTIRC